MTEGLAGLCDFVLYLYVVLNLGQHFKTARRATDHKHLVLNYMVMDTCISMGTLLYAVLLIVPGILFLVKSSLALVYLTLEGRGPVESIRLSQRALSGHVWEFLKYMLPPILAVAVPIILLGSVPVTFQNFFQPLPWLARLFIFASQLLSCLAYMFMAPLLFRAYEYYRDDP